jgi:hypothetical protein
VSGLTIHVLPTDEGLRPKSACLKYPAHNQDYGVEQDFLRFLLRNRRLLSNDPKRADWHYLPVFWTRYHLNHGYGTRGVSELQAEVAKYILDDTITFTICQYDDGPLVDLGRSLVFLASRQGEDGVDIPLLCAAHKVPLLRPPKRYLASFQGRLSTHPIRAEMARHLANRPGVLIVDRVDSSATYVQLMLKSYVALCPRGYGGSSFRFFEALQLGTVPLLVGDVDTRPFKQHINWNAISLFCDDVSELANVLDGLQRADLVKMGRDCASVWLNNLTYQKWCKYVLAELESRS